jgi:hypothetical protein
MLHIIKNTIKFIGVLFIGMAWSGCKKDFLDINPKGQLIAQKTSDYDLLLNSTTLTLTQSASQTVMSDEVATTTSFNLIGATDGVAVLSDQKAFMWADDIYQPGDNSSELTPLVKQIYTFNKIINEVMTSDGGSDSQKKSIQAEALAGRAWANFMLVNYYGKPYNSASSATDLGFPLPTTADVTQTKFTRATVQSMYNLILSDLIQAIPNLPSKVSSRVRMSKAAGEGLLGKVYVFMGQFDKALPLLTASIDDLAGATIPVGLYNFSEAFAPGGAFMPISPVIGPSRTVPQNDNESLFLRYTPNYYTYIYGGILLSPQTVALFKTSDLRRQFYTAFSVGTTTAYPKGMLRAWGRLYVNEGINVSDIYLLKAECKSRLGNLNGAVSDIQSFRLNRMPAADVPVPSAVAADQVALTKFILEERIREFAVLGSRWFDMRRLSVDPVYKLTVGTTHAVYDSNGNIAATYTLKPERLTFRFPQYITAANPDLMQNP